MTDPVTPPTGSGRPDDSHVSPATADSLESAASTEPAASAASAVLPLNATVPFPISEADTDVLPFESGSAASEPTPSADSPGTAVAPTETATPLAASAADTVVLPSDVTAASAADTDVLPSGTMDRSGLAETEVLPTEPVIPEFTAFSAPREGAVPLVQSAAAAASAGDSFGSTPPPPPPVPTAPTTPAYSAPGASASETWPAAPARRRHPLFGTIFWGTVMLAFSGFIIYRTLVPGETDPALWLLGGVILMGLVLIVAGIAAAARRAT